MAADMLPIGGVNAQGQRTWVPETEPLPDEGQPKHLSEPQAWQLCKTFLTMEFETLADLAKAYGFTGSTQLARALEAPYLQAIQFRLVSAFTAREQAARRKLAETGSKALQNLDKAVDWEAKHVDEGGKITESKFAIERFVPRRTESNITMDGDFRMSANLEVKAQGQLGVMVAQLSEQLSSVEAGQVKPPEAFLRRGTDGLDNDAGAGSTRRSLSESAPQLANGDASVFSPEVSAEAGPGGKAPE